MIHIKNTNTQTIEKLRDTKLMIIKTKKSVFWK